MRTDQKKESGRRGRMAAVVAACVVGLALASTLLMAGESKQAPTDIYKPDPASFHPVTIEAPPALGQLKTELTDVHGEPVGVMCSTCHADREGAPKADLPEELTEFHTDMEFAHGNLTCSSCHHPEDRDKLRLSNGKAIAFADTMDLCAQCHGTQYRSYENGAHGGMNGHWDLSKGPRTRNNCVSCHNPHTPAYPQVAPAPPPRDRFFGTKSSGGAH